LCAFALFALAPFVLAPFLFVNHVRVWRLWGCGIVWGIRGRILDEIVLNRRGDYGDVAMNRYVHIPRMNISARIYVMTNNFSEQRLFDRILVNT
jgi:hypothetical protein